MRVGEKFKDGRYTVLHKLGWGHFSTVWMVVDEHSGQQAAMKVMFLFSPNVCCFVAWLLFGAGLWELACLLLSRNAGLFV